MACFFVYSSPEIINLIEVDGLSSLGCCFDAI